MDKSKKTSQHIKFSHKKKYCGIKVKYKYVKEFRFGIIVLAKKFILSMIIRIFATSVPTKPLNDAQMCGSFFIIS